jgi:hypothetical protein
VLDRYGLMIFPVEKARQLPMPAMACRHEKLRVHGWCGLWSGCIVIHGNLQCAGLRRHFTCSLLKKIHVEKARQFLKLQVRNSMHVSCAMWRKFTRDTMCFFSLLNSIESNESNTLFASDKKQRTTNKNILWKKGGCKSWAFSYLLLYVCKAD